MLIKTNFNFRKMKANAKIGYILFILYLFLAFSFNLESHAQNNRSSVLSSGEWHKIRLNKTGIYKITYDELVNLGLSNPSEVRIYGNVGGQLPFNTNEAPVKGLKETPLYIYDGGDDNFNSGDYILFFGQGPTSWAYNNFQQMFMQNVHDYSDYSYYFLTSELGVGKRIAQADVVDAAAENVYTDYVYYDFYELNDKNLIKSGRQWFEYLPDYKKDITFNIPEINTSRNINILSRVVGRSKYTTSFSLYLGSTKMDDVNISSVNLSSHQSHYAIAGLLTKSIRSSSETVPVSIRYNRISSEDKGYLDYLTINAYRQLKLFDDQPMLFRQLPVEEPTIVQYQLQNANTQTKVWDITDPHDIREINPEFGESSLSFKTKVDGVGEFAAFHLSHNFLKPEFLEETVPNQDLLGMDPVNYVIVTPTDFVAQAEELAELHRTKNGMTAAVVTLQQIYNDFSSGAPDVSAIRDFFKWMYDKDNSENRVFRYALLFGDGTYDNKNAATSSNFVLTFQSNQSLHYTRSYVADDFYAFLEPNEGNNGGTMDIGIGRFPVQTESQAVDVINKIALYLDQETMGPWRNRLCFVGDDGEKNEGTLHMRQADLLTSKLKKNHPEFQIHKVYLDAFKQQVSANGTNYPEAEKNIYDALENGLLLFNYTGHGSEEALAHERIILKNDIQNWNNAPYFPLFITATCEFSRFDADETTAGEYVLLNANGGGIALLTTTRLVYSQENFNLNSYFYDYAFRLDQQGQKYSFGDVLRLSKNAMSGANKRNFSLLGDPALALNYPLYRVYTDSINNIPVSVRADTISAFSEVTVSGFVGDFQGNLMDEFNGSVYPVILDKEQKVSTLNNDGEGVFNFNVRNNIIYKGKASVKDGRFNFQFLVPKDIGYSIGQGKIVYYAENQDIDAHGYDTVIYIGGTPNELIVDNQGPEIELFLNDSNFIDGGITDANPKLFATITDESGVNATGAGIGHDIIAYLNGNTRDVFVLNEFYETAQDNFKSGFITYPLQGLEPGQHTITLKVWDIINNSAEKTIEFQVLEGDDPILRNVFNYPNPFSTHTHFNVEHNMAGQDLNVTIEIFDMSGRLIRKIERDIFAGGYRLSPIQWDGTNGNGEYLDAGIYPYRITLGTENGNTVQKFSKLILQ